MVRRPPAQEDFLYWIMGQVNDTSSPYVHSVSYGDVEASIPLTYKTQVDMEFKKMGSLGRAAPSGVGRHWDAHRHTPASLANALRGSSHRDGAGASADCVYSLPCLYSRRGEASIAR